MLHKLGLLLPRAAVVVSSVISLLCSVSVAAEDAGTLFERRIAPVLEQRCASCHNPDKREGGFDVAATAEEHTKESLQSVKENIEAQKAVLVDVRDKQEWDKGHVAGAIFLPLSEFRRRDRTAEMLKDLPKDRVLYTHCVVGMRALKAAEILKKHGYEVRALKPGYDELIKAGFESEKAK